MLLHGAQSPSHALEADQHQHPQARQLRRKRKAESQDNEQKNGQKLYVPVEEPTPSSSTPIPADSSASTSPTTTRRRRRDRASYVDEEVMQLDDSKHKVYIYNIDDELSSSESEPDEGKLVFLPNIEKHLRQTRIPPSIFANDEGQLAGMQVVLYNEPASLTVPREQDSVRKAIVESRARMRERQRLEREGRGAPVQMPPPFVSQQPVDAIIPDPPTPTGMSAPVDYDSDAMDMD
ncbi:hypothetical protein CORC01_11003 [Colletotrichum orchidophilum]|uniref:Uncharacterized protein n=1 Tax=Colletotrichum orchidophilum TaxID=1209926 RepID=A0A1G4AX41_9PEZI|nr:uncharacterized protein CORC01_11003 [Colletotrichum orchidophilum]OHE93686.1 hypothetical protein CORC01_11003 [Colletotrichum orchidophilum]